MLCAGQVYESTLTVRDAGGALTDPATVTLTVTKPDGTAVTPAPVPAHDSTGTYSYDYILPAAGLYKFAWSTTSPATAPTPDYVNVRDFISIVSRAEVKQHLNITTTTDDDELAKHMMGATELVEAKVGICVPRAFTERVTGGPYELVLPVRPVLSVTTVTSRRPGGQVWDNTGGDVLDVDGDAGIIALLDGGGFWDGPWDVALTAGRRVILERFIDGCMEQIRHTWETQRGSMPPSVLGGEKVFTATSGWSFTVPRRVLEYLEQDMVPSI